MKTRHSFRFSTPRGRAIMNALGRYAAPGQGHNATTVKHPAVVGTVVGLNPCKTTVKHPSTTPQRQNGPLMCVRTRARPRMRTYPYIRCTVVDRYQVSETIKKMPTTVPTTVPKSVVGTVVATLPKSRNPLKNNKKGGF